MDGVNPAALPEPDGAGVDGSREAAFLHELDRRGVRILDKPSGLRAAEVLTWIGSGLMVLLAIVLVILGVTTSGDNGITRTYAIAVGVGMFVQAAVQLVGVYWLQRAHNGGRITLTVIAVLNVLVDIQQILAGTVMVLLILVYIVVTVALMWSRRATEYLTSERQQRAIADSVNSS